MSGATFCSRIATSTSLWVAPVKAVAVPASSHHAQRPGVGVAVHGRTRTWSATCSYGAEKPTGPGWQRSTRISVRRSGVGHQLRQPEVQTSTNPSGRSITFSGLMSRWTMPGSMGRVKRRRDLDCDVEGFADGQARSREPLP